jgi:hypothetical protein
MRPELEKISRPEQTTSEALRRRVLAQLALMNGKAPGKAVR